MARIFLIIESRIIGRRCAGGPCFFPGLRIGVSVPDFISAGYLPVFATEFNSTVIPAAAGPLGERPPALAGHFCKVPTTLPC